MNAKKCDRCNKYYDTYGVKNNESIPNAVLYVNADKNGNYHSHNLTELCPECKNEVKEFISNKTEVQND